MEREQDVASVAGARDAENHITRPAQRPDELGKFEIGRRVVGHGGAEGRESRERDGGQTALELLQGWIQGAVVGEVDESGPHKPFEQLTGDVIGIGGTPTIAREEELATVGETGFQDLKRCLNVGLARQEARVAGKKLIEVW